LETPKMGCLNIHASLLPRWRGAAPIQRSILAGDGETGVSIMQMDEGLDTGPVLLEEPIEIYARTTAQDLHDQLSKLGARLIVEALDAEVSGAFHPKAQPTEGVTYAAKLTKDEGYLDWSGDALIMDRTVRAFTPWPGCSFLLGEERVKLLESLPILDSASAEPGTILSEDGVIACGTGALRLVRVQRPGRGPVTGEEFLRGLRLSAGAAITDAVQQKG